MSFLRAYDALLTKAPISTKTTTAFVIFGLCEFNAQLMISDKKAKDGVSEASLMEKIDSVDWRQVAGYGCLAFYNAPMMHTFYNFALKKGWSLPTKIVASSLLVDPINISMAMLLANLNKSLCAGETMVDSFHSSFQKLQDNYVDTMKSCLMVWPAWHTVNWVLMPAPYRVLGFNIGSLGWNTYLTYSMWMIEKTGSPITIEKLGAATVPVASSKVEENVSTANIPSETAAPAVLPEVLVKKEECPWKFKGLSGYRHLCPHLKDKEVVPSPINTNETDGVGPVSQGASNPVTNEIASPSPLPSSPVVVGDKSAPSRVGLTSWQWLASWVVNVSNPPPASCEQENKTNDENIKNETEKDEEVKSQMTARELRQVLGTSFLINARGDQVKIDNLVGKTLGLYFSASWCPPCRRFTPILSETYLNIQKQCESKGQEMEFIFITADQDELSFDDYRQKMPFLAVPYTEAKRRIGALRSFFGIRTIPHLLIILPDGTVCNGDAASFVREDPSGSKFPWSQLEK